MNALHTLIFGKKYTAPLMTKIGGVSASLNTASAIASVLGISVGRIANFSIVGSDIQFNVTGGTYIIPFNSFSGNLSITYYNDEEKLVTQIGENSFFNCENLVTSYFPEVTSISNRSFANCYLLKTFYAPKLILTSLGIISFYQCFEMEFITIGKPTSIGDNTFNRCYKMPDIDLSNCTSIGLGGFRDCRAMTIINAPLCTNVGVSGFNGMIAITSISIPTCTALGTTVGDNSVFLNIKTGCSITVPIALATNNGGLPDGDLQYAVSTRSAIVTYI